MKILDLKLDWNDQDRENATVPTELYERACVTDGKEGVEVRRASEFKWGEGALWIFISNN